MIRAFMRSPLPNTLAVLVLAGLIIAWITSLLWAMRNKPVETEKGPYTWLLPLFALLGLPAMVDLLQTSGIALAFAALVFLVFAADFIVPILKITRRPSSGFIHDWTKWAILISAVGGLAVVGY